jgi:hypothetical protein
MLVQLQSKTNDCKRSSLFFSVPPSDSKVTVSTWHSGHLTSCFALIWLHRRTRSEFRQELRVSSEDNALQCSESALTLQHTVQVANSAQHAAGDDHHKNDQKLNEGQRCSASLTGTLLECNGSRVGVTLSETLLSFAGPRAIFCIFCIICDCISIANDTLRPPRCMRHFSIVDARRQCQRRLDSTTTQSRPTCTL